MATALVVVPETKPRLHRTGIRLVGRSRHADVFFHKHIDNSRLVREVDTVQHRRCYSLLAFGLLAFAFVFGFAVQHFECVRYGYKIQQLRSERAALKESTEKLLLEQALLSNPQRIDRLARADLNLAPSQPQQVIRLDGAGTDSVRMGPPVLARNFAVLTPAIREVQRAP